MSTSDFYWPPYDNNEHSVARVARSAAFVAYSVIAYALFLGTIGYFFLFVAGIVVPKTVDRGSGPLGPTLLVDILLLLLFGLQHSTMARSSVKRRLTRVVPKALERSTFVLASGLVLLLIFWLWRPIPAIVWYAGGLTAIVARAALWGGVILAVASTFVFSHAELFGLQQPYRYLRGGAPAASGFRVPLLYRLVRHPMHLGMLIVLWATPVMTAGHLLFALGMTAYVLVGIRFEERDLIRVFGDGYRAYRQEVPALIPFLRPRMTRALLSRPVAAASGVGLVAMTITMLGGARSPGAKGLASAELDALPRDSVVVNGLMRSFGYYLPTRASTGAPIVVALHGTGGSGERLRKFLGGALDSLAEHHGFVVAYPDAVEGAWNTCRSAESAKASRNGVDDVAMVSAVARQLVTRFRADSTRVFALGYSGGGHLGYRLALEGSDVVRGVAVIAANLPVPEQLACTPSGRAMSLMIVNGNADLINPFDGGAVTGPFGQPLGRVRSAAETAAYFGELVGAPARAVDDSVGGAVVSRAWTGRDGARVVLYTVRGGGHSIPGGSSRLPSLVGRTERRWSVVEEAVRFFRIEGNS